MKTRRPERGHDSPTSSPHRSFPPSNAMQRLRLRPDCNGLRSTRLWGSHRTTHGSLCEKIARGGAQGAAETNDRYIPVHSAPPGVESDQSKIRDDVLLFNSLSWLGREDSNTRGLPQALMPAGMNAPPARAMDLNHSNVLEDRTPVNTQAIKQKTPQRSAPSTTNSDCASRAHAADVGQINFASKTNCF